LPIIRDLDFLDFSIAKRQAMPGLLIFLQLGFLSSAPCASAQPDFPNLIVNQAWLATILFDASYTDET
jgi:hypothetical protein